MSPRSHRGSIAWAFLATCLTACSSWKVYTVPPAQLLADKHPAKIRITLADSSAVVLTPPELLGDTLVGQSEGQRMGIATSDAVYLAVRKKDAAATVGLIGGLWVLSGLAFIAAGGEAY
jgi:hypothetical protein